MEHDRSKYETLIQESVLFSLDRNTEEIAYKREAYKLIENIYCYLMAINRNDYEQFACEIMDVATRCIKNYDVSTGVFLHYFNAAWKKEYSHITSRQISEDKLRGLKITDSEKRNVIRYMKLLKQKEYSNKETLYEEISEAMSIPIDQVMEIAALSDLHVEAEMQKDKDGDFFSIFDRLSTESNYIEGARIDIEELLSSIDNVFMELQERQKPIISDVMTAKVIEFILEMHNIKQWSFINIEIMEAYSKGRLLTQRDIAIKHGRNEASISRTTKDFIKKLKERMDEDTYGTE